MYHELYEAYDKARPPRVTLLNTRPGVRYSQGSTERTGLPCNRSSQVFVRRQLSQLSTRIDTREENTAQRTRYEVDGGREKELETRRTRVFSWKYARNREGTSGTVDRRAGVPRQSQRMPPRITVHKIPKSRLIVIELLMRALTPGPAARNTQKMKKNTNNIRRRRRRRPKDFSQPRRSWLRTREKKEKKKA